MRRETRARSRGASRMPHRGRREPKQRAWQRRRARTVRASGWTAAPSIAGDAADEAGPLGPNSGGEAVSNGPEQTRRQEPRGDGLRPLPRNESQVRTRPNDVVALAEPDPRGLGVQPETKLYRPGQLDRVILARGRAEGNRQNDDPHSLLDLGNGQEDGTWSLLRAHPAATRGHAAPSRSQR